jgi:hypothetical protein
LCGMICPRLVVRFRTELDRHSASGLPSISLGIAQESGHGAATVAKWQGRTVLRLAPGVQPGRCA